MATSKKNTRKTPIEEVPADGEVNADGLKSGELILRTIPAKQRKTANISSFYTDKCRRLLESLAEMIQDGQLTCSPASDLRMRSTFCEMRDKRIFPRMTRDSLCDMYYSFGGNIDNIISVCRADKRYEKAWKLLTTSYEVSSIDIKSELGRSVEIERDYGWMMELAPEALFAPAQVASAFERYNSRSGAYEVYGQLTLRAADRKKLADYFFGKDFSDPHLLEKLPDDANLTIEDFEQATAADLMTLEGLALNGSMLTANGSVSVGALKKAKSNSQMKDFTLLYGKWPLDRVEMICLTYFTLLERKKGNDPIDIKMLARFAVDDMPKYIAGPIFNTFMPAWQSFTKSWASEPYTMEIADAVRGVLMSAAYEWMSLDNFKMQLLCDEPVHTQDNRFLKLFPYKGRSKNTALRKIDKEHEGDRKWKVKPVDWFEEMGFKFAIHWLKYLCAVGIVELAVDTETDESSDLPMEGMRFVRLTSLGRFAFHIDQSYTPKTTDASTGVEFDGQNGILTVQPQSPYLMFLTNVAKRISPTRFHISAESLMKGCHTKAELEQRVSNLNIIIDSVKEPAIRKIIDEAMSHTDCVQREGGYSLLKLRSDLPDLREAILANKELRGMTILAGPTLALVKTNKMDRFNTILASYGFLID